MMPLFLALLPLFFFPLQALAATPSEPAYKILSGSAGFPWNNGLSINFTVDEKFCQKKYGNIWRQKCASFPGKAGQAASGIAMKPHAAGYWQWDDGNSIRFIPANASSLRENTTYIIDLANLNLPPSISLDRKEIRIQTSPLAMRMQDLDFWIDPSPKGAHRLACMVEFNYPVQNKPEIVLKAPPGALYGNAEMIWSGERDKLNISWPIRKLPAERGQFAIHFKDIGQISEEAGIFKYFPPQKNENVTVFQKNLPGAKELFFIKSAGLESSTDASLNSHYILKLETSLYASLEELLQHLLVYELPEFNSPEAREACNWRLAPAIDAEIIKKARKIEPFSEHLSGPDRATFELRIPVSQGRYILCALDEKFMSASGQKISRPWIEVFQAEPFVPQVGFLQPGNVLAARNGAKLELFGRQLEEISWQAQLVRHPFLALLASSSWNPFQAPFASLGMDIASFTASCEGKLPLGQSDDGKGQFAILDLDAIMPKLVEKAGNESSGGLVLVSLTGKAEGKNVAFAQRLILLSSLGMLVKRHANGQLQVFVKDLAGAGQEAGLDVRVLGANGLPVATGKTDAYGQVLLPSLRGLEKESFPTALLAGNDRQFAWLPLNDYSRELNYSDFNISGSHIGAGDLNIFIFNQRDLYRPGDTVYFGTIVRKGDLEVLPNSVPLYAQLQDPRGISLWQNTFQVEKPGLAELSFSLPKDALSGRYVLSIRTAKNGPLLQSKNIRVEEFQPETLKLKASIPSAPGWLHIGQDESQPQVELALQNLYGTAAAGHKIKALLELETAQFHFPAYEGYIFNDYSRVGAHYIKRTLPEVTTDSEGKAKLDLPLDLLGQRSAQLIISAEGFTAGGGRATVARTSILSSPLPFVLGFRPCGDLSNLNYIPMGAKAELHLLAINPDLEKIALKNLRYSLFRKNMVTSLISDGNGNYKYGESPFPELLGQWEGGFDEAGTVLKLNTDKPGAYLLEIKDANGNILNSVSYEVAGNSLELPDSPLHPARMRISLEKNIVQPGAEINFALSLPYKGQGLISLEREGVEAWKWFQADAGESVQSLRIPENFEGKGYLVINFIRDTDSTRVYMSPLSFAVEPLNVLSPARNPDLEISVPERIIPGQDLKIRISAREKSRGIVYIVDEGVLQLTGYRNPDPLKAMLYERSLDVATLQALDLLMPSRLLERNLSAYGGGMDGASFGSRFQNPFKRRNEAPVTAWFGNLDLSPEGLELSLPIPDYYNGQLRIIAIGLSENSAGSANKSVLVQAPFLINPQLPLYVAPGDIFKGTLVLANNEDRSISRTISISNPGAFIVKNVDPAIVNLQPGEEKVWNFELEAPDIIGAQELCFEARGDGKLNCRKYSLSIRPSSSLTTSIQAGRISGKQSLPSGRAVYKEMAESAATISTLPLALAQGLGDYLSNYPYGCSEQLISRAFGNFLLKPWLEIKKDSDDKILEAALVAIKSRITDQGLALWPGGEGNLLLSAYAANFLLSLRKSAAANVEDLIALLCDLMAENCGLNESTLEAARASAYAIWVLTREGRITSQLLEELLLALQERQVVGWEKDLTALLMAASQREMRMSKTISIGDINYKNGGFFDEFAQYALHMTLLARYFPELLDSNKEGKFFDECAFILNKGDFATFSATQALRALASLGDGKRGELLTARIYCPDTEEDGFVWANGNAYSISSRFCPQYEIHGEQEGLFWQIRTTGFDLHPKDKALSHGIVVEKEYFDIDGKALTQPSPGQETHIRIRARSELGPVKDCVISDLLPGGLEAILDLEDKRNMPEGIKYIDRQEDRILVFTDLEEEPLEFTWKARAVTEGKFTIPPASAEGMYNRNLYGQSASGEMRIINE